MGVLVLIILSVIVILRSLVRSWLLIPTPRCLRVSVITSIPAITLLRRAITAASLSAVLILVDICLPDFRSTPRRDVGTTTSDVVPPAACCP